MLHSTRCPSLLPAFFHNKLSSKCMKCCRIIDINLESHNLVQNIPCLNKQATMDDDPTGIRWINSDLIGLKYKMKNIKMQKPIQRRKILNLV